MSSEVAVKNPLGTERVGKPVDYGYFPWYRYWHPANPGL